MSANDRAAEIKVSVVVPVYNVECFLPQCLDSLIGQTLSEMEIICLDDGSTDRCGEILDRYAEKDSRIRVIHKQNEGCGATMNRGFAEAQGEYVGIVESDDFAAPDMFEALYRCAKDNCADVVKSDYYVYRNGRSEAAKTFPDLDLKEGFYDPRGYTDMFFEQRIWAALYNRDFLQRNRILQNETPGASYQDVSFNFQVMSRAEKIYYLPKAYLHYRMDNPGSSIRSRGKTYALCAEMEHAENYLKAYCSGEKELYYILANIRFRLYQRDAIVRIHIDDKYSFLQRAAEEYQRDEKLGRYEKSRWTDAEWEKLQRILKDPADYLERAAYLIREREKEKERFLAEIGAYPKIYIYGAGQVAGEVIGDMEAHNIEIAGILVRSVSENPPVYQGIDVTGYISPEPERNDSLVLIALSEKTIAQAEEDLKQNGYRNLIRMDVKNRALFSGYLPELDGE